MSFSGESGDERSPAVSSILAEPPSLAVDTVAAAVETQFCLVGDYTQLVSERDQNFRLVTNDGKRYVVKVTSVSEDPLVTDFQIATLIHLEGKGVAGVPRIVRTPSGIDRGVIQAEEGAEFCLRVVTWLDGQLLSDVGATPDTVKRLGLRLAQLNRALKGFSHAGESQYLLWDSQRAGDLRALLIHVDDKATRAQVEKALDDFDSNVSPALGGLPGQIIHNDANDDNILLDSNGDVSGIIDFGDMLKAPRVIEVSTAASYLRAAGDPLELIEPFVAAYNRENPLSDPEKELLFDLIRIRLSMTLILLYWRLEARHEDDPYRQKAIATNRNALQFLEDLSEVGRKGFNRRIIDK